MAMNDFLSKKFLDKLAVELTKDIAKKGVKRLADTVKGQPTKKQTRGNKVVVMRDGVMRTETQRGRGRKVSRKKVSLKKKVNRLMKNLPKNSIEEYTFSERIKIPKAGGPGRGRISEMVMFNTTMIKEAIASLATGIDFTVIDSKVLLKNIYMEFELVNAVTCNTDIEYMWVVCKDSGNLSYLNDWFNEFAERVQPLTSTIGAEVAPTTTQSKYPRRLTLFMDERYNEITRGLQYQASHWRKIGKVRKATLGPGDKIKMIYSLKSLTYADEKADQQSGSTYLKDLNIHLIVKTIGALAHDQTNVNIVTAFDTAQDCVKRTKFNVVYNDGTGIRQMVRNSELDIQTGVTTPVQVDDKASAVEIADD